MLRKISIVLILVSATHGAFAEEFGASIDSVETWFEGTGPSSIDLQLTRGTAQNDRVLFINRTDKAVNIVDMNMARIRTIKPRQSVDISESVSDDQNVAISIGGEQLIYLEVSPGMSVIAANSEEDAS